MRKMMTALAAVTMSMGMAACGEAPETEVAAEEGGIAGTWKVNLDSASFENDNRNFTLADGQFQCDSCTPPYGYAANGEWQTVDRPGVDSQMIEVVDDNTVKFASRLGDKDLGGATWTISEDGQTATADWTDLGGDAPVTGKTMYTRTAPGAEGSHAMSGEWAVSDVADINDEGLTFTYTVDGDTLTSTGNGDSWTATFGGEPVAIEGSDSGVMVAVERLPDNSFRETYSRDGETLSSTDITIDGNTLSGVSSGARDGSVVRWTATRQ